MFLVMPTKLRNCLGFHPGFTSSNSLQTAAISASEPYFTGINCLDWVQSEADEGQRRGVLSLALLDAAVIPSAANCSPQWNPP